MRFETEVSEVIVRAPGIKSIRFPRPKGFSYRPGQWLFAALRIGGGEVFKPLSISSSPTEPSHLEFTKKLTGSAFSQAVDALAVGSRIGVNAPFGEFIFEGDRGRVGMLTGGIGITPVRSMIKYCTDAGSPAEITLIYSCHSSSLMVFVEELQEMQRRNPHLKVVLTLTGSPGNWTGCTGRINAEMIRREIPDYAGRAFFVSGPQPMVEAILSDLKKLSIPDKDVKTELFLGYTS